MKDILCIQIQSKYHIRIVLAIWNDIYNGYDVTALYHSKN